MKILLDLQMTRFNTETDNLISLRVYKLSNLVNFFILILFKIQLPSIYKTDSHEFSKDY